MDRFTAVVARINTFLIFLGLLGVGALLAYFAISYLTQREREPALVAEDTPTAKAVLRLNLGMPEELRGADTLMIHLTSEAKYGKFSSGGSAGESRNLLFLKGPERKASWLFKNNLNRILNTEPVKTVPAALEDPVLALLVQYVSADTNEDGELSDQDASTVGLAKPDGTGFMTVLPAVDRMLDFKMQSGDLLSIVYQQKGTLRHARFSLARFKLESDQEILQVRGSL